MPGSVVTSAKSGKRTCGRKGLTRSGRANVGLFYIMAPRGFGAGFPARAGIIPALMTEPMDIRRKRLLFRSWHRGTKEADLLLGSFAERHLAAFTPEQVDRYEA